MTFHLLLVMGRQCLALYSHLITELDKSNWMILGGMRVIYFNLSQSLTLIRKTKSYFIHKFWKSFPDICLY